MTGIRRSLSSGWRGLILVGVGVCACGGDDLAPYSVADTRATIVRRSFRGSGDRTGFRRVLTLGNADGNEPDGFGFIADAAFGPDGTIYVADAGQQRVAVYNSAGGFRRAFGRSGSGPGEFLSPSSLAFVRDTLFVYDSRQGRISVFDTSGRFHRAFTPPSAFARHIRSGPDGTLLVTIAADSFVVTQIDLAGNRVRQYVKRPAVEASLEPADIPEPGPICRRDDNLVYANPWRYELVWARMDSVGEQWALQYRSDILRPVRPGRPGDPRREPVARGGGVLGLTCGDSSMVFGYLDVLSGAIRYDVLDPEGMPLGRHQFHRDGEEDYPGFLTDLREGKLLAFRSRPFPQVSIWALDLPTSRD